MAIAIRQGKNIRKNLEEIFQELNFVPGKRVFVKPNLCGREPILPGENTSIEVMDALVDLLLEKGCEVIIGHDALLNSRDNVIKFEDVLKIAGYAKYKTMENVEVINLDELLRQEIKIEEMTFHLPLDFLKNKINTYINLAKMKTHMETTVSFSLKNQMGLPVSDDRMEMHKTNLEKTIAKLAQFVKPDLSIIEAFPAMEGNGPHHGPAKNLQLLVAGRDMVELDSFVCEMLGYDSRNVRHIKFAADFGVGKMFVSDKLNNYKRFFIAKFVKAKTIHSFGLKLFAYPTYSCALCIVPVDMAGQQFKKRPLKYWRVILKALFSRKKINIIFGREDGFILNKNEKNILIGDCTKLLAEKNNLEYLPGCPADIVVIRDYLVKKIIEK